MVIHYFTSPLLFYLFIFFFANYVVVLLALPSLVLNLIHPKTMYSLSGIEEASVARLQYLQSKASGDVIAHIYPNNPQTFMVNLSIGSPPVMQLLHMDTASSLTWLQCRPCSNCYPQSIPVFDPSGSSTYRNEFDSCGDFEYSGSSLQFNAETRSCEYSMKYMDGSTSKGILIEETLTFNTIYGESSSASLSNVSLGCGHDNFGVPETGTGVLGLGYGRFSLVHRFGSKFSYCFGSFDDGSDSHSVLVIGDGSSNVMGDTTPLEIDHGLYFVSVKGISINGALLPINPVIFQHDTQTSLGGTIIDTGTSLTMLVKEAYDQLKSSIEDVFYGRFTAAYVNKYEMQCYNGDLERDLVESGFPNISFQFADGAELSLDAKSLFEKAEPNVFCLAVVPSGSPNWSIIGAQAQQNYNIGYDLVEKKVYFESIDCGVLFDY